MKRKILLVDEGEVLTTVFTSVLDSEGYGVYVVSTWEEALFIIEKHKPNMIIFEYEK